ncbi:uncharacterized protein A1O5_01936 [Cladophialophora psammophila CBS 110553]|uniref:Uncharacterized protein n=1 Tax=Cladophialophora psammophila CBS 110553 TaxID=1182543 RepID=W9XD16_9EURO|nr:uncharacterized protein A1O5_01936 [Cladophialophora psammophila CBS 110553]EXJ75240.1 hypothetical protein A1O5_01936 [Cladophialophora psammophila CBS 110553]
MASFQHLGPFGSPRPTLVTALHSQVRQEAEYIQERIAAAEGLYRKLTMDIIKTQTDLGEVEKNGDSEKVINSIKRKIRKKRSRLNRCVKNRQIFETQLATIFGEMRRMEQRQWRHHSASRIHNLGMSSAGDFGNASCTAPSWPAIPYMSASRGPDLVQNLEGPILKVPYSRFPQDLYQSVPNYVPQTPVLRPTQIPQLRFAQPHQQECGVPRVSNEPGISPTDTVSTYELSSPRGFPVNYTPAATQQVDLLQAMSQMHISQPHESLAQTSSIPTMVLGQRSLDLSQHPSMLDHQSVAFQLQKAAKKGRGQRSC